MKQLDNLRNRIAKEVYDWKYSQLVLEHSKDKRTSLNNIFNVISNLIAVCGIVSWWNLPELKNIWAVILLVVAALRLTQNIFLTSQDHLSNMDKSLNFYYYHINELEQLLSDFYAYTRDDIELEAEFIALKKKHSDLVSNQIFKKINISNKLVERLSRDADLFQRNILKNINE